MNDLRKAAEMALEALQKIYIAPEHEEYIRVWWPKCEEATEALRQALAQQEQVLTARVVVAGIEHESWCDSVTKLLLSMPPQIPPCNCKLKNEQGNSSPNYPITESNTPLDKIVELAIQGHASTRDAIRWAMQQEREACALLCEEIAKDLREEGRPVVAGLRVAAKEIRAGVKP